MEKAQRLPLPEICKNFVTGKNDFAPIPRIFFSSKNHYFYDPIRKRTLDRIPPDFFLFTCVLFSEILNGNPQRAACFTMRDFGIHPNKASLWTAAYSVSGFMKVTLGTRHETGNQPTRYEFIEEAEEKMSKVSAIHSHWSFFVCAINEALYARKQWDKEFRNGNNVNAFKVTVAAIIDKYRIENGMQPINAEFLRLAATGEIRDTESRQFAEYDKNGKVVPIFYKSRAAR